MMRKYRSKRRDNCNGLWKVDLWLTAYGKLVIEDEELKEFAYLYVEEIMVLGKTYGCKQLNTIRR